MGGLGLRTLNVGKQVGANKKDDPGREGVQAIMKSGIREMIRFPLLC